MLKSIQSFIGLNLWIAIFLNPFSIIQPVYAGKQSSNCQPALQAVQTQLKAKLGLEVVSISKRDLSEAYPDHPKGRPNQYIIALRGTQTANLLNSPRLMINLATQMIRNCESVSLVMFGFANSGYTVLVGLMPDGSVQPFECVEPKRGAPDRQGWGKTVCV